MADDVQDVQKNDSGSASVEEAKSTDSRGRVYTTYTYGDASAVISSRGDVKLVGATEGGVKLIQTVPGMFESVAIDIGGTKFSVDAIHHSDFVRVDCEHDVAGDLDDATFVNPNKADQVIAQAVHQFARENPEIAAALSQSNQKLIRLNSLKSSGRTFQDILDLPSEFRGCPKELAVDGIGVQQHDTCRCI
jgi:hypothetical protein